MNMIVSSRARTHARAITVDKRNGFVAPRSIVSSLPMAAQARRSTLRAHWSLDPVSGRLECRWTPDDDVPDSCRDGDGASVGELRGTFVERLAA